MSRQLNILFINQPAIPMAELERSLRDENVVVSSVAIPLGILYMSSYLKKHVPNVNIKAIDFAYEVFNRAHDHSSVDNLIEAVADEIQFKPDIIAFSAMFSVCHPFLIKSISKLKNKWLEAVSIVSGNQRANARDH
ncbi:hypothetical protein OAR29_06475 [Rhodospirillales bacterium]|nr:hypothetical protein [Rhodospirillales bacterium]